MLDALKKTVKAAVLRAIVEKDRRRRAALGMLHRNLDPANWDAAIGPEGELIIGGCDAVALARRFGTPLHVVDKARLQANFAGFQAAFRRHYERVHVAYSYKTNPLPAVLRALHDFGAWAEVISHFELWLATQLGVPPERIIYNGPGKTSEGVELALSQGIGLINVDSEEEVETIARSALRHGRRQRVGVRVVASVGWSSQFGLSLASGAALQAFDRMARMRGQLEPAALHIHLGTGIHDISMYLQAVEEVLDFAARLKRDRAIEITTLDLGGGFGVPTVRKFSEWDQRLMANGHTPTVVDVDAAVRIEACGEAIGRLLAKHYPPAKGARPALILEPGRAITSSAQTLLLQVMAVKQDGDKPCSVICDGGKNITMPMAYEYHEIFAAAKAGAAGERRYDLYGPLCHPGDILAKAKLLPRLQPGDVIAVMDAGAYFIPNQMNFSNPRPAAVMVEGGEATLIRSREKFEDIVAHDQLQDAATSDASERSNRQRPRLAR